MRATILTGILLLLWLTGCGKKPAVKGLDGGGDSPDSPIVVADSSVMGTQTGMAKAAPYHGQVGHPAFTLYASGSKPMALVRDTIPVLWGIFNTARKVTSFEVNTPSKPTIIDLTQYQSWALQITSVPGTICPPTSPATTAPCIFTLSSGDNKAVTLDPGNVPMAPTYDADNGLDLLNTGYIASATLTGTDSNGSPHQLYPASPPVYPPQGDWKIQIHYCKRSNCK